MNEMFDVGHHVLNILKIATDLYYFYSEIIGGGNRY